MEPKTRMPLFINRFSLSPRTAIGVQTVRLLDPYEDWIHFHWWASSLKSLDPRSVLLENPVLSRYSFLHNQGILRFCERLGLSSWTGDRLRPSLEKRLAQEYRDRVSVVYLAPLGEGDAKRCLQLLELVDAPFILHLWDVLEGDLRKGALRELVDGAQRVFCVSHPLVRDVRQLRGEAELLLFSRDSALTQAQCPQGGPLRIVMHGNVSSYAEGLNDLDAALSLLEDRGVTAEVSFYGSPKILRQARTTIKKRVRVAGFVATQQQLDVALSQGHIGFLPGPKLDPRTDLRSRYSIPSRIVDYLAVGLPVLGTIHEKSATSEFARYLGLDSIFCYNPEQLADRLYRLFRPEEWLLRQAESQRAFAKLQGEESPALTLKRAFEKLA